MKYLPPFFFLIFLSNQVNSQIKKYFDFKHKTEVYNELQNPIILSPNQSDWSYVDTIIVLPFKFGLFQQDTISSFHNGISFYDLHTLLANKEVDLFNIMPLYEDVTFVDKGDTSNIATVSYQIDGNIGNRIAKFQYENVTIEYEKQLYDSNLSYFNIQVWLYEIDGRIDFRYGDCHLGNYFNTLLPSVYHTEDFAYSDTTGNYFGAHFIYSQNNKYEMYFSNDSTYYFKTQFKLDTVPQNQDVMIFKRKIYPSIAESNKTKLFSIHPNPTNGLLKFNLLSTEVFILSVYDINSKKILSINQLNNNTLNLNHLEKGCYFLEIIQNEKTQIDKIVIN